LNKKLIIVDSNCLAWKAFYSVGHLSSQSGQPTGIIFGFLNDIFNIAKHFRTNQFIFCFDNKYNFRKDIYKPYKSNRKDNSKISYQEVQSVNNQIQQLRKKILKKLGFKNVYSQFGFESDDLMHFAANLFYDLSDADELEEWENSEVSGKFSSYKKSKRSDIIMVTNDGDMYQSLSFCNIYNPSTKKLITKNNWEEENGISSDKWGNVKALWGCQSDNVKGIKGAGKKKSINYLNGDLVKGKIFDRIESKKGKKIYKRNLKLVKLPYYHEKESIKIKEYNQEKLKAIKFVNVFSDLDFQSFLNKDYFKQWKEVLELNDEYEESLKKGR